MFVANFRFIPDPVATNTNWNCCTMYESLQGRICNFIINLT